MKHGILLGGLSLLISQLAMAEEEPAPEATEATMSNISVMEMLIPLLLVIVLIFLLAWAVKKINPRQMACGSDITLLSTLPLSSQARLCLVRVGSKDILVGVTQNSVQPIETFKEPVIENIPDTPPNELSQRFKQFLSPNKKA